MNNYSAKDFTMVAVKSHNNKHLMYRLNETPVDGIIVYMTSYIEDHIMNIKITTKESEDNEIDHMLLRFLVDEKGGYSGYFQMTSIDTGNIELVDSNTPILSSIFYKNLDKKYHKIPEIINEFIDINTDMNYFTGKLRVNAGRLGQIVYPELLSSNLSYLGDRIGDLLTGTGLAISDIDINVTFTNHLTGPSNDNVTIDRRDFDIATNFSKVNDGYLAELCKGLNNVVYKQLDENDFNDLKLGILDMYKIIRSFDGDRINFDGTNINDIDYIDINDIFTKHNIPFKFRKVCSHYQLMPANGVTVK